MMTASPVFIHMPVRVDTERPISLTELYGRLTDSEKETIYTLAKTQVLVEIWIDELNNVKGQTANLNDPRLIGGFNALEFGGAIGSGRAAEILA